MGDLNARNFSDLAQVVLVLSLHILLTTTWLKFRTRIGFQLALVGGIALNLYHISEAHRLLYFLQYVAPEAKETTRISFLNFFAWIWPPLAATNFILLLRRDFRKAGKKVFFKALTPTILHITLVPTLLLYFSGFNHIFLHESEKGTFGCVGIGFPAFIGSCVRNKYADIDYFNVNNFLFQMLVLYLIASYIVALFWKKKSY